MEAHRFVDLLRQARPMPRLVVLNSCSGAVTGVSDLFSGVAAALVRGGVSAVTAMQYEISDTAAMVFARGFYSAIAHGRDIDEAVSSGRVAILGLSGRSLEWVTPVLYLHGDRTQLFSFPGGTVEGGIDERPTTPAGHPAAGHSDPGGPASSLNRRRIRPVSVSVAVVAVLAAIIVSIYGFLAPSAGRSASSGGAPHRGAGTGGRPPGTPRGVTSSAGRAPGTATPGTPISVGSQPDWIAITPDGKTAYVTDNGDGTVTPITLPASNPG